MFKEAKDLHKSIKKDCIIKLLGKLPTSLYCKVQMN
jgi:hypothetical protein